MTGQVGRIPSGRFRELGPINWVIAKLGARTIRAPEMHLFTTLGQRRLLFWAFAFYGGDYWIFLQKGLETNTTVYQMVGSNGTIASQTNADGLTIVGAGVSTCAPIVIE